MPSSQSSRMKLPRELLGFTICAQCIGQFAQHLFKASWINYSVFQALWEDVKEVATDPEIRARVIGADATMNQFDFLFGLASGERLMKHIDNLSRTLQAPSLTASKGQEIPELARHSCASEQMMPLTCSGRKCGQCRRNLV